jgi:hypothetical protein
MRYRKFAITAFFSTVLVPAYAQEQLVLPKEIQDTWVSRTLIGTTANGARATLRLQPDGTASLAAGSTSDTGTWRLSEQGYCTTWKNIYCTPRRRQDDGVQSRRLAKRAIHAE